MDPYDELGDDEAIIFYDDFFDIEWPSEDQVISWNIHNDHADGADYDDV